MTNRRDEIAAMTDEELNAAIAEGIGLPRCECEGTKGIGKRLGGWIHVPGRGPGASACGKWCDPPNFARSFDALLASEEHGGFVGPVAWLENHREHDFVVQIRFMLLCVTARDGPRALAKACLLAIEAVNETGDATEAHNP